MVGTKNSLNNKSLKVVMMVILTGTILEIVEITIITKMKTKMTKV